MWRETSETTAVP